MNSLWCTLEADEFQWKGRVPVRGPFWFGFRNNALYVHGQAVGLAEGVPWWCLNMALPGKTTRAERERMGQALLDIWQMKYNAYMAERENHK